MSPTICAQLAMCLVLAATLQLTNARLEKQCGCFPDWVQCDNGRCIPKSSVCDNKYDCHYPGYTGFDHSDEEDCGPCPTGFKYVPSVKGCYSVVLENLEWSVAGLRCRSLHPDAHLLIINNAEEQNAIKHLMSTYSDTTVRQCTRYTPQHSCKELFWTGGQRIDLSFETSSFAWKCGPGTGSCYGGTSMSEMRYTAWNQGEPNNRSALDSFLKLVPTPLPEKCMLLCRGWNYLWNDAVCEIPACSICEVDIKPMK